MKSQHSANRFFNLIQFKDSTILQLTFASLAGNVVSLASGFYSIHLFSPFDLGNYSFFNLITGYLLLFHLGIGTGAARELPYYLKKNESRKAEIIGSVSNAWHLIISVVSFSICFFISIFFFYSNEMINALGVLAVGVGLWQSFYTNNYLRVLYRAEEDFKTLAKVEYISVLFNLISIVLLSIGIEGLFLRLILMGIFDFIVVYRFRPNKFKPTFNYTVFSNLFKVGAPIYIGGIVTSLWPNIIRTIVVRLGGFVSLGLFVIPSYIESTFKMITSTNSTVQYPKLIGYWAEGKNLTFLLKQWFKTSIPLFIISVIFCALGFFLLPPFVSEYLPKYNSTVSASKWMLFYLVFSPLNDINLLYNVIKKQRARFTAIFINFIMVIITLVLLTNNSKFELVNIPKGMILGTLSMFLYNIVVFTRIKEKVDLG